MARVLTAPADGAPPRSRPYWLLISAACLVPAVLDAVQQYVQARLSGTGVVRWPNVLFAGGEWIFLGALTPITWVLARRFPLRPLVGRPPAGAVPRPGWLPRALLAHLGGALVLCVAWASLGVLAGVLLHAGPVGTDVGRDYVRWVLTSVPWSVFMYFTVLGCVTAFTAVAEVREREAQSARLAAQLAEAQLGALRAQLHPHFLFNSLNTVAVLVRDQDTRGASRMLELLGGVLRQVLRGGARPLVPLEDELRFLEQYLAIEQVRFSDRLRVGWAVDPDVRDALVPEFLLQPLVENAVRHGVARQSDAGRIDVTASEEDGALALRVRDDGPGYRPEGRAHDGYDDDTQGGDAGDRDVGVGLANTRARLATLYGDAAQLWVEPAPGGGTVATVRLPLRRASDASPGTPPDA